MEAAQRGAGRQPATPGLGRGAWTPAQQESQVASAGPSWSPRLVESAFEVVQANESHKLLALTVT